MEASMTMDNEMIKSRINAAADNVLEDYKGDMLYHPQDAQKPMRIQGAYVDEDVIPDVVQRQRFSCKIQFKILSWIPLDMECNILAAQPIGIPPTILPVAQRPLSVYFALSIIQLPEMKQRFPLFGQFAMDFLNIKVPVVVIVGRVPLLLIKKVLNVLVRHLLRKRPAQFLALFKALEKLSNRRFAIVRLFADGPAAVTIHIMKAQHPLVVHTRTPLGKH